VARRPELAWTAANFLRCLCGPERRGPEIDPAQARRQLKGRDYLDDYFAALLARISGWTGTMLVRREVLLAVGLFETAQRHGQEDTDLWWRIAYRHPRMGYDPEPLAVYHYNITGSLTEKRMPCASLCDLLDRHLKLSSQYGCRRQFEPIAGQMVIDHSRAALFDAGAADIKEMMRRYRELVPWHFRALMGVLTLWPNLTAGACHAVSRVVRGLHLRREIMRPPPQPAAKRSV
jgi:hypothetical protein